MLPNLNELIGKEGGYSNNPSDLGGETNWGITKSVARANGYTGDMRTMPRATAEKIYLSIYWTRPRFNEVAMLSESIAEELFDTGVNMGVGKASEFLQVSLNAFNKQGTLYPDIGEDGTLGSVSISTLKTYLRLRGKGGEQVMLKSLNCLQGARYIEIARSRKANEDFVYGWILNRVKL